MTDSQKDSWLVRPSSIRLMWIIFIVILALTVGAQFFVKIKGYFGIDAWFGFGAAYGFLACLAMVIVAKLLGFVLKRSEQYYDAGDDDV